MTVPATWTPIDQSNWTAYGRFMYKICDKWGMLMAKHEWLYLIMQYTWGCIMTTVSIIVSLALMPFIEPVWYYGVWYFPIGRYWGGLELGMCFLTDDSCHQQILSHELGHCMAQATLLGPLFIPLVWIPSACRYWIREFITCKRKYDDIWFEASATETGAAIVEYLKEKEEKEGEE